MKTMLKILGCFLLSLIFTLTMINVGQTADPKRGGDLKVGCSAFPMHFLSAIQSGQATAYVGTKLFAGLVEFNDKKNPWEAQPMLAKSWEVSDDHLTYTFHLVENATFHDGKPITSEDVAFSLDIVKNNHAFGPGMWGPLDRVETPDPYTAVIKLKKPHPAVLIALSPCLTPIIPKHIYNEEEHGPVRQNPANVKPVGSGPFKFVELKPGNYYILERNENYFRKGRPYLDRIIGSKVVDAGSAEIAFKNQEFHYGNYSASMRLQNIARLKKEKHLNVHKRGYAAIGPITYLEFNMRKKPYNDIRVRRAIAHAINREYFTQKLQLGLSEIATGPIVRIDTRFYTSDVPQYEFNLDKANKLLDEAGYPRKDNGIRFSATMDWIPGEIDNFQLMAEYLKQELANIGIDIKLRPPVDYATWIRRVAGWEHELCVNSIYSWADPLIGVHRLYLCDNQKHVIWTNTEGYCNRKADAILEKASSETNFEKRKELYYEWQKMVATDLPLAWTHETAYFTINHKDLQNLPEGIWGGLTSFDAVYWKDGHQPK